MSDDFIETIWAQFAIETEEHTEIIERLLMAAESGSVSADSISALFRSFHSIKGLAKALGLIAMESVAHSAEDLLGLVRSGTKQLDAARAALLLESLDALKNLYRQAAATRADGEVPVELVERLRRSLTTDAVGAAPQAQPAAEKKSQAQALHDDPEMMGYFVDMLLENLPLLAEICLSPSLEKLQSIVTAIEGVEFAAETMGFLGMAGNLHALADLLQGEAQAPLQTEAVIANLKALLGQVRHIEEMTDREAGGKVLAEAISYAEGADVERWFEEILAGLTLPSGPESYVPPEHLRERIAATTAHMRLLAPDFSCDGLLLLADMLARPLPDYRPALEEFLGVAGEIIALTRRVYQCVGSEHFNLAQFLGEQAGLIERLRNIEWDENARALRDFVAELPISKELVKGLSAEHVRAIKAALDNGEFVYEILADMESSEEKAAEFLRYIGENGKAITSRTVFVDEQSCYELLVVSRSARSELEAGLKAIDPQGKLYKLMTPGAAVAAAANVAPMTDAAPVAASSSIRVPGETLDRFMNRIGDMVLVRSRLEHALRDHKARDAWLGLKRILAEPDDVQKNAVSLANILDTLEEQQNSIAEISELLSNTLTRLQDEAMELRVVPMETVFRRLPRVVRDLAQALSKRVHLVFSGEEVRIDKAMVEILVDPLLHMVRNSVDHGIEAPEERRARGKSEEASIHIKAKQQGSNVYVQIIDDGRGIDPENILAKAQAKGLLQADEARALSRDEIYQLLFVPGFSTAEKVTETSGRGVGMDVVRANVLRMGGSIQVDSEVGRSTTITLQMPLSVAIQQVLMVDVGQNILAIPRRYVAEIVEFETHEVQTVKGKTAIVLRGSFLPVAVLGELIGLSGRWSGKSSHLAVVLVHEQHRLAVTVDRVQGAQELFVKDIHPQLMALPGVGGAAILGNGRVVLILDGDDLFKLAAARQPASYGIAA
ncbi:MAG: hypothetical protein EPN21_14325 [Methylococcaceae bacterium]|nr:MAG: hypothetical protein EPN21_14325 [Methylococcaceae bacterium]